MKITHIFIFISLFLTCKRKTPRTSDAHTLSQQELTKKSTEKSILFKNILSQFVFYTKKKIENDLVTIKRSAQIYRGQYLGPYPNLVAEFLKFDLITEDTLEENAKKRDVFSRLMQTIYNGGYAKHFNSIQDKFAAHHVEVSKQQLIWSYLFENSLKKRKGTDKVQLPYPTEELPMGLLIPSPDAHTKGFLAILSSAMGPIGDYGIEHTRNLAITGRILMDISLHEPIAAIFKTFDTKGEALSRQIDPPQDRELYSDAQRGLAEGIITIFQAFNQLTLRQVPRYENPTLLVKALGLSTPPTNGLISQFALKLSPGQIGPMSLFGRRYKMPHYITVNNHNTLSLSTDLLSLLNEQRQNCLQKYKSQQNAELNTFMTCLGCPIAYPFGNSSSSSLQMIVDLFVSIYDIVSKTKG